MCAQLENLTLFSQLLAGTGRTFGHIKRIQSALLPIMFKLGILSAVIVMTLFLALKGVFIGTIILIINLTFFAIKFGSYLKADHHHTAWAPPVINHGSGWPPHKDVHLHIHNAHAKPDYTIPYSTIDTHGWQQNAVVDAGWTSNSYGPSNSYVPSVNYGHAARSFNDIDLTYGSADHTQQQYEPYKPKIIGKRENNGPTIVMAQSVPNVSPYNYMSSATRHK